MPARTPQQLKADSFRALHEGEPFVIPNPWDAGSAVGLPRGPRFQALATDELGLRLHARTARRRAGPPSPRWSSHVALVRRRHGAARLRRPRERAGRREPRRPRRWRSRRSRRPVPSAARSRTRGPRPGNSTSPRTPPSGSPRPSRRRAPSPSRSCSPSCAENHIRGNPDLDDTIARLQAYETGRRRRPVRARPAQRRRRSVPSARRSASRSTSSPAPTSRWARLWRRVRAGSASAAAWPGPPSRRWRGWRSGSGTRATSRAWHRPGGSKGGWPADPRCSARRGGSDRS